MNQDITSRILPDCYIYISHLDSDAQFWKLPSYPDDISDSMDSSFNHVNALGRSAPVFTYSHSGPRSIQFSFNFHRDMFIDINDKNPNAAEDFIHAIQAIALPKYNLSNKAVEPPLVGIRLGQEIFIKGVVTSSVGVKYSKPILSDEKYAIIEVSFTVSEVDPYDATTVYQNGSFRGLTDTMRSGMNC